MNGVFLRVFCCNGLKCFAGVFACFGGFSLGFDNGLCFVVVE